MPKHSKPQRGRKAGKPKKPYPDFPLFPHATKRWAKKIRGKLHYFGPWRDPDGAEAKYKEQREDLHAGRTPRIAGDGLELGHLLSRFLTAKRHLVDTRELSPRTWADYKLTCDRLDAFFGRRRLVTDLAGDDFEKLRAELAGKWGPVPLANEIQRVRTVFKFAHDHRLIQQPVWFGPAFKKPSKKTVRLDRASKGPRLFTAPELQKMIRKAGPALKAMILLGVNAGFGNRDCGSLPTSALDLKAGWAEFPRPKTGVARRCKLWPETVAAIRAYLKQRPEPKTEDLAGLVFVTKHGASWAPEGVWKQDEDGKAPPRVTKAHNTPITQEMGKLLDATGIDRAGRNFYTLRRTFRTVADECRDQPAIDHIMGHEPESMASVYRQAIADERLYEVSGTVRAWLFGKRR